MPFPVAHGLLGAAVVAAVGNEGPRKCRVKEMVLGAFLGFLPDLDFVLNDVVPRSDGVSWHHGFTHSIGFAVIVGSTTAILFGRRTLRMALAYVLAVTSHPVLDFFLTEGYGVALLWPLSDERFRMGTSGTLYHAIRSGDEGGRLRYRLVLASVIEAAALAPVLVGTLWLRARRSNRCSGTIGR